MYNKVNILSFASVFIGIIFVAPKLSASENLNIIHDNNKKVERGIQSQDLDPVEDKGYVIVESINIQNTRTSGEFQLIPYKDRRKSWGSSISLGYSAYNPIYYEPDFQSGDFETVYDEDKIQKMIEFKYTYKRNFSFASLGFDISLGSFNAKSSDSILPDESSLSLTPIQMGLVLDVDGLFAEPYMTVYLYGGVYSVLFNETQSSQSYKGNTAVAPYYGAGLKFQLNALDPDAARIAYEESGIENIFLFVDIKNYARSSAEQDKYFDTDKPFASGGINVEF